MNGRRGEMGIGTLIVLIAGLLIAAIAATVLITTSNSMQETSFTVADGSKKHITTNLKVIGITASDAMANLTEFEELVSLSPGAAGLSMDHISIIFNTDDVTATLKFRGIGAPDEKSNIGYNTFTVQEIGVINTSHVITLNEDFDNDTIDDTMYITDTQVVINMSDLGAVYVSLGADISAASGVPVALSVDNVPFTIGTKKYGYININGTTDESSTILETMTFEVIPYDLYRGYYTIVYENEASNNIPGRIRPGDVVRLNYEAPRHIREDERVAITLLPFFGSKTTASFYVPQAYNGDRLALYP